MASPDRGSPRLIFPPEHGAWAMLSFPFVVGAIAAGGGPPYRVVSAAIAVLTIFLLRAPLQTLVRRAGGLSETDRIKQRDARFSILIYGSAALISILTLCLTLPLVPLAVIGSGAFLVSAAALHPSLQKRHLSLFVQLASAVALTSSSLLGYLAAAGHLSPLAVEIWACFAAQVSVSVMVVRAQLEFAIDRKRHLSQQALAYRRAALAAEALLWVVLIFAVLLRSYFVALAFLIPSVIHLWSLWRLRDSQARISLRTVGFTELAASLIFSFSLLLIL